VGSASAGSSIQKESLELAIKKNAKGGDGVQALGLGVLELDTATFRERRELTFVQFSRLKKKLLKVLPVLEIKSGALGVHFCALSS
jgi:hypothetical protein